LLLILFSFILTWDDKILNNCDNASLLHFGHTWFKPDQYAEENYQALNISYANGAASYNDFNVFAIKVVFFSSNQSVVPQIKALRATAVT
jgi:hypothetical protein